MDLPSIKNEEASVDFTDMSEKHKKATMKSSNKQKSTSKNCRFSDKNISRKMLKTTQIWSYQPFNKEKRDTRVKKRFFRRIAVKGGVHFVQIGIGAGIETQSKMPDFNVEKILRRIGA